MLTRSQATSPKLVRAAALGRRRGHIPIILEHANEPIPVTKKRPRDRQLEEGAISVSGPQENSVSSSAATRSKYFATVAPAPSSANCETNTTLEPLKAGEGKKMVRKAPQTKKDDKVSVPSETKGPPDWRQQYDGVVKMRAQRDAAVDSMGTETFLDPSLSPATARLHVLVGAMLSSQTKDEQTSAALSRLKALPGGLTIETVLAMPQSSLAAVLRPVGFFNNKAKYMLETFSILKESYGSDIPDTLEGLVALPGIGPKMAYLILDAAWQKNEGICVDIHVHRIANRLRWVKTWNHKGKSQNPEKTRVALEEWLPRELWSEINVLFVGFGQQICKPVRPSCDTCAIRDICPKFGV
jgi:endonuclease-3